MTKFRKPRSAGKERQHLFAFLERQRRHERWFKRVIVCATLLATVVPLAALPRGRYLAAEVARRAKKAGRSVLLPSHQLRDRPGLAAVRLRGIAELRKSG